MMIYNCDTCHMDRDIADKRTVEFKKAGKPARKPIDTCVFCMVSIGKFFDKILKGE